MSFLLPYCLVAAAGKGGAALELVRQEIHAIMQVRCRAATLQCAFACC